MRGMAWIGRWAAAGLATAALATGVAGCGDGGSTSTTPATTARASAVRADVAGEWTLKSQFVAVGCPLPDGVDPESYEESRSLPSNAFCPWRDLVDEPYELFDHLAELEIGEDVVTFASIDVECTAAPALQATGEGTYTGRFADVVCHGSVKDDDIDVEIEVVDDDEIEINGVAFLRD